MKQVDRRRYLSLFLITAALVFFFLKFRIEDVLFNLIADWIAAGMAVAAILNLMMDPRKTGPVFNSAFFIVSVSVGVIVDYPFEHFPPTLFSLPFIMLAINIRNIFYQKFLIYKLVWIEAVLIELTVVSFAFFAYKFNYNLLQWLTGGIPIFLWGFFSVVIFKDRNDVVKMLAKKNILGSGSKAPDFTLPNQDGHNVTLSEILKTNHALLIFVRGDWCPTCHMMLRAYVKNKDKFAAKNVKIIGVGPDPSGINKGIMNRIDENSLLLSDEDQATALLYTLNLQENNPVTKQSIKKGIPLPASFLVHRNGNIIFTSSSERAGEILQPEKIFEVLEKLR